MTDADVDGSHIQVLLITFFYRYMRPLIEEGRLYIATPPLYKIEFAKNEVVYAYNDDELKEYIDHPVDTPFFKRIYKDKKTN